MKKWIEKEWVWMTILLGPYFMGYGWITGAMLIVIFLFYLTAITGNISHMDENVSLIKRCFVFAINSIKAFLLVFIMPNLIFGVFLIPAYLFFYFGYPTVGGIFTLIGAAIVIYFFCKHKKDDNSTAMNRDPGGDA